MMFQNCFVFNPEIGFLQFNHNEPKIQTNNIDFKINMLKLKYDFLF